MSARAGSCLCRSLILLSLAVGLAVPRAHCAADWEKVASPETTLTPKMLFPDMLRRFAQHKGVSVTHHRAGACVHKGHICTALF